MNHRITRARHRVTRAEENLAAVVKEVQRGCPHKHVAELPYRDEFLWHSLPRRICCDCGLEEEAWHWPGYCEGPNKAGERGYTGKTKLNSSFVHRCVDSDEFYKFRP